MNPGLSEAIAKLEYYCAYQERCHSEVVSKLYDLKIDTDLHDLVIVHLISENYLNEERFARGFARGKHRISSWGKNRIKNELKQRKITDYLITKALTELDDELYFSTFEKISLSKWNTTTGKNIQSKKQKVIGYLHRKGYELDLIYDRITELESQDQQKLM